MPSRSLSREADASPAPCQRSFKMLHWSAHGFSPRVCPPLINTIDCCSGALSPERSTALSWIVTVERLPWSSAKLHYHSLVPAWLTALVVSDDLLPLVRAECASQDTGMGPISGGAQPARSAAAAAIPARVARRAMPLRAGPAKPPERHHGPAGEEMVQIRHRDVAASTAGAPPHMLQPAALWRW